MLRLAQYQWCQCGSEMLIAQLTRIAGYHRSLWERGNAPFIHSIAHTPEKTFHRLRFSSKFSISSPPAILEYGLICPLFMEFRRPKAPTKILDGPFLGGVLILCTHMLQIISGTSSYSNSLNGEAYAWLAHLISHRLTFVG